ncbi:MULTISPECIES: fused response regulator/phosphatase [Pseudomonas]|uniref:Response regulator n=1 Tax=Pseudomonas neustonica TaxID=2487346 RepID=A0ABX9XMR0_9PSED|nr:MULTISPECIES: fused response regulator/phosphatase [Pseudomonas]MBA6420347.1 fused response regulator/phosphatase [Pseudomonas sp. 5Ae-yellow]ROZ87041.1 response regulator [Pseudomonas sp. SSM44]ROZ88343.1 response regulator [Pseudomonas neustonica]|tara:strand:+ start:808 stop:2505 length:1698 start_codon:yes stop_codon:yes gene_type:complete
MATQLSASALKVADRLTVLVADDNPADRMILGRLVERLGHQVYLAENGQVAVEQFSERRPDIVLLDALMPVMDGFEAARLIKQQAGEDLVPIIFLTSLTETDALVQCLEAGGDDFLTKPYNPVILDAKISAFRRMREMHQTLQAQRDVIAAQHASLLQDQEVAKIIFDRVAHSGALSHSSLRYLQSPYAMFNGDILLAANRPSGEMHLLLGDFTGHGLSAAIGAMPLAEVFYAMTAKGFALRDILFELNDKLATILPVGIFCCAVLIEVNPDKGLVEIWNGGLPDVMILGPSAELMRSVASTNLPLGVANRQRFNPQPEVMVMRPGERLLCWTDGVIESRNQAGELFGEAGVHEVLDAYLGHPGRIFDGLLGALERFHGSPEDDVSLLQVVMPERSERIPSPRATAPPSRPQDWCLSYTYRAASIREQNPLPFLLSRLLEIPGLRPQAGALFTVLSELYSNALEHGLLRLDSAWKQDSDGFALYYQERGERLRSLVDGWIRITLNHLPTPDGGMLQIECEDSGNGFAPDRACADYAGRGLALVAALAQEVEVKGASSTVRVVFSW